MSGWCQFYFREIWKKYPQNLQTLDFQVRWHFYERNLLEQFQNLNDIDKVGQMWFYGKSWTSLCKNIVQQWNDQENLQEHGLLQKYALGTFKDFKWHCYFKDDILRKVSESFWIRGLFQKQMNLELMKILNEINIVRRM